METQISPINLMAVAEAAALRGGSILRDWQGRFSTREKSPADLVTDADVAAQEGIREVVAKSFPEHRFLGEESRDRIELPVDGTIVWIVDPLDGTTNYVHGFPFYAVSVAAVQGDSILAGVIYDPVHDVVYRAAVGEGAWRGGQRLSASRVEKLSEALVAVSFPPRVTAQSPDLLDFLAVVGRCQAVRRTGSAALNLAAVAAGQLDAHWAWHINPWDVAAGILLIREAGGIVTSASGEPFDLWRADYHTAGTRELHAELRGCLGRRN